MPSLYANLLDPKYKAASISGEAVKYEFKKPDEQSEEEKKTDAYLRFQPVKRPQVAQKPKPRPQAADHAASNPQGKAEAVKKATISLPSNSTFERWTANAEDDFDEDPYAAEYNRRVEEEKRRQRGGRRNKRKKKGAEYVDWDSPYDPERPTRLDLYRGSEEAVQATHDWKMRLHAHQFKNKTRDISESDSEHEYSRTAPCSFAPPSNYNFAPPDSDVVPQRPSQLPGPEHRADSSPPPPPPTFEQSRPYIPPVPAATIPADASGEDAYMRRMRMAETASMPRPLPLPAADMPLPSYAAAPGTGPSPIQRPHRPSPPAQSSSQDGISFSSAPELRNQSTPPTTQDQIMQDAPGDLDDQPQQDDVPQPRSNRPGQKGFAERLLKKYGWKKGEGLGADGTGITTILQHQKAKRKKRPDAEGGGWIGPAGGVAKIVGGKRQKTSGEDGAAASGEGQSGAVEERTWSIVAVFRGMLAGVDVQKEIEDGSLMQDIGDAMARFGIVERLFLDREGRDGLGTAVFVKFTSALSAYRAIQASDGKDFLGNGRTVSSGFWKEEKFEEGIYE